MPRSQYEGDPRSRKGRDFTIKKILRDSNPLIQKDPDLLRLEEELRRTAPRTEMTIDPKFKRRLGKKLKKIIRKNQPGQQS